MRLPPEEPAGPAAEVREPEDWALRKAVYALGCFQIRGPITAVPPESAVSGAQRLAWFHAVWRTLYLGNQERVREAGAWLAEQRTWLAKALQDGEHPDGFAAACVWLDLLECAAVFGGAGVGSPLAGLAGSFDPQAWADRRPRQPVEGLTLLLRWTHLGGHERTSALLDVLAERLGRRRAAELALEEGDLLRLRLPDRAGRLYDTARTWFAAARDQVGTFLCGVARMLAGGPHVAWAEAGKGLESIQQAYKAIRDRPWPDYSESPAGRLPPWSELERLAVTADEADFNRLVNPGWRPWLVRLLAVLNKWSHAAAAAPLTAWLERAYGLRVGGTCQLPVDFEGWFPPPTLADADSGVRGVIRLVPKRRTPFPADSATRQEPIRMEVFSGERAHLEFAAEAPSPGLLPYERAAGAVAAQLGATARQWLRQANRHRPLDVVLDPAEECHGPCWEALVSLQLPPESRPALRFRRVADGRLARRTAPPPVCRVLTVTGSDAELSVAESGWSPLHRAPGFEWTAGPSGAVGLGPPKGVRVLHLLGTPVQSQRGVRFRASLAPSSDAEAPVGQSELARKFPEVALCVLQMAPRVESVARAERTQADRHDMQLLREFAAGMFALGVAAVLVIPRLELSVAAGVLRGLAGRLVARAERGAEVLLAAVAQMRQTVRQTYPPGTSPLAESEYDLCVYADGDWDY
jgi:hypothetical protein